MEALPCHDFLEVVAVLTPEWLVTQQARVAEAATLLGSIEGVTGLILGGSVGRGESWPLSDVDMIIVYADGLVRSAATELDRRRSLIEDFWGWCGVSGSLDLGALWFTESEAALAVALGAQGLADRVGDPRWFHAMDKAYGGCVLLGRQPVVVSLSELFTTSRFDPIVVAARVAQWASVASSALSSGSSALSSGSSGPSSGSAGPALGDVVAAAEAMIDWVTERWGGRCSSLGRRWTRFEAFAAAHGHPEVAATILACRGATVSAVGPRIDSAPWWLRHRIENAYAARLLVGEDVTPAQNARDQVVAFAHLWRRRGLPPQPWAEPVPPTVPNAPAVLAALLADLPAPSAVPPEVASPEPAAVPPEVAPPEPSAADTDRASAGDPPSPLAASA